jgi:hypothetical protein
VAVGADAIADSFGVRRVASAEAANAENGSPAKAAVMTNVIRIMMNP